MGEGDGEMGEAAHATLRHLNTWASAKEGLTASLTYLKRGILWACKWKLPKGAALKASDTYCRRFKIGGVTHK